VAVKKPALSRQPRLTTKQNGVWTLWGLPLAGGKAKSTIIKPTGKILSKQSTKNKIPDNKKEPIQILATISNTNTEKAILNNKNLGLEEGELLKSRPLKT